MLLVRLCDFNWLTLNPKPVNIHFVGFKIQGIESLSQTLYFLIPISLQPNVVDLRYFKIYILIEKNLSLKYQRFTPSGGKNLGISKLEY